MTPDIEKLRALLPELEVWKGGERRDLDAKIAEAFGWRDIKARIGITSGYYPPEANAPFSPVEIPYYLGTDPAIATEDAQRLVRECGLLWERNIPSLSNEVFWVVFREDWEGESPDGPSLILALIRALIANGEGNGKAA